MDRIHRIAFRLLPLVCSIPLTAYAEDSILAEIRLGVMQHDVQFLGKHVEKGQDINLEVLFRSPGVLASIWSPRPHMGVQLNNDDFTNQLYAGLTWDWQYSNGWFSEFHLGGALHDGETDGVSEQPPRKELGCAWAFRLGGDLGYRFDRHHGLMLHFDHMSNAGICGDNEGINLFGLRYGYRF